MKFDQISKDVEVRINQAAVDVKGMTNKEYKTNKDV
jgi:hypothetical protein